MGAIVLAGRKSGTGAQAAEAAEASSQYLTFVLGGEAYAIAIAGVREIIEYHAPTSVPMMPPFVRGVINLRGRVVPVIDLQARFGRPSSPVSRRTCIVVLEVAAGEERQALGAVVDSVTAVVELGASEIEPAPSFGGRVRSDFIVGMGKLPAGFVLILDASRVLSVDELATIASAGEAPSLPVPADARS